MLTFREHEGLQTKAGSEHWISGTAGRIKEYAHFKSYCYKCPNGHSHKQGLRVPYPNLCNHTIVLGLSFSASCSYLSFH